MVSDDLSWSNHLIYVTNKSYKKLGLLRRSLSIAQVATKKRLYVSLIRSQLLYCSQIWHPYLRKDIKLIENVQRRATKFILNDYIFFGLQVTLTETQSPSSNHSI